MFIGYKNLFDLFKTVSGAEIIFKTLSVNIHYYENFVFIFVDLDLLPHIAFRLMFAGNENNELQPTVRSQYLSCTKQ